jgi:hypothetical protein
MIYNLAHCKNTGKQYGWALVTKDGKIAIDTISATKKDCKSAFASCEKDIQENKELGVSFKRIEFEVIRRGK